MKTRDRQTEKSSFFTVVDLGRSQKLTPEGFLLCEAVPIARAGEMHYRGGELPAIQVGADGIIRAHRDLSELINPLTIASGNGKAITVDHPDDDVVPGNWGQLSRGSMLNLRQGDGALAEFLVADFLITHPDAIALARTKPEVSLGYDAEYEQTAPGRARQYRIIINHVALVPQGRCGPRCSIGDQDMRTRDNKTPSLKDRLLSSFGIGDKVAFEAALGDIADGAGNTQRVEIVVATRDKEAAAKDDKDPKDDKGAKTEDAAPAWFKDYATTTDARMQKFEDALTTMGAKDAKPADDKDDKDKDGKTKDAATTSTDMADEFRDTLARAEILAPGIKLATFDAAVARSTTTERLCALRRRALVKATEDEDTGKIVQPLLAGRTLDSMPCEHVEPLFTAAAELVRGQNSITMNTTVHDHKADAKPASISDINAANKKFWAKRGGCSAD